MKRMVLRATGFYLAYELISTVVIVFIVGRGIQLPGW